MDRPGQLRALRRHLPLLALPLAPAQGLWLTRRVPRFPDADGRRGEVGTGERRLRLVVIGDSVAAGYAVAHHRATVAGALAERLAAEFDATVSWEVVATTGFTAGQAVGLVDPETFAEADIVFVSIGVNDTKNLHSAQRFRRELVDLIDAVVEAAPRALVAVLGIPPLEQLPVMPRPLADVLGWRGRAFDAISAAVVATRGQRVIRIVPAKVLTPEMFGPDGFHPSEYLHALFADAVMRSLPEDWSPRERM